MALRKKTSMNCIRKYFPRFCKNSKNDIYCETFFLFSSFVASQFYTQLEWLLTGSFSYTVVLLMKRPRTAWRGWCGAMRLFASKPRIFASFRFCFLLYIYGLKHLFISMPAHAQYDFLKQNKNIYKIRLQPQSDLDGFNEVLLFLFYFLQRLRQ